MLISAAICARTGIIRLPLTWRSIRHSQAPKAQAANIGSAQIEFAKAMRTTEW